MQERSRYTEEDYKREKEDKGIYRKEKDHYSNKGDHAERSKGNDTRPNGHRKWWQKREKQKED